MNQDQKIFVTQPSLSPLKEFIPYLEEIWENKILTNGGKFHQQLEAELCKHLGVKHISLFNNGTIALMTAIKALDLTGEVITTPYSFIATSHSIVWNGLKPVFVDIDEANLNLNPDCIEKAITDKTSAILPVHCYGYPCDVEKIKRLADKHNLSVIYDAAHAFGVRDLHGSILNYGDLSVLSFHATKVFNTFEGGAIVSHTKEMKLKIDSLKNFGYESETSINQFGLNGKLSEVNSAFGLLQLKNVNEAIRLRGKVDSIYRKKLAGVQGIKIIDIPKGLDSNFSYFPILVTENYALTRDQLHSSLFEKGIVARKYFYPLISEFKTYKDFDSSSASNLPVATRIASQILCLPIYSNLEERHLNTIVETIVSARI